MRHSMNPNVRAILEELQGQTVVPQGATAVQPAGAKKPGAQGPQQVAAGVQNTATAAAQQAAGDVQAQIAQQNGANPAVQAQANKVAAVQPKPAQVTPQMQQRGVQADAMANRKVGQAGQPVVAQESEAPPLPKGAPTETANGDEEDDYNGQSAQTKRAKERAKEIDVKAGGPDKTSTMGLDGADKGQKHNEITKPDDLKPKNEGIFSDSQRKSFLDEIFGA